VDELTRADLSGGGWESGSCATPADDNVPEWPELLAALDARVERLLDAKRAERTIDTAVRAAAIANPYRARQLVAWLLSDPADPDAPPMPGRRGDS
jgi:hypothetical protein